MFISRLNQAKDTARFVRSVSATIDMSLVSPRVRALAKNIVISRHFDRWSRAQSGILAYAVYKTFAPEETPVRTKWNYMDNPHITQDWLVRFDELLRTNEALLRMRSQHYGVTLQTPVEERVEEALRRLKQHGAMPYLMVEELRPKSEELVAEALSLGAERDAEITALMCDVLDDPNAVFTVNI